MKYLLLALLVASRAYSARYMIIADCDETFNYWEPLNYILRGFGKETWEYSPEYAIRSYSYLMPYYLLAKFVPEGIFQFYWLRFVALCGWTAYTEYKLYTSLYRNMNPKIANWFLFFSTVAPGMQHAGVALLPSSWAMNWVTLATASSLKVISHPDSINSVVVTFIQFIIAGILGWPFALALAIPFGVYILIELSRKSRFETLFQVFIRSIWGLLIICGLVVLIDYQLYNKLEFVPLNIVLYNVFGGEGEGPEIFGVEEFNYYPLNLLLNFNLVFIFAIFGTILSPFVLGLKSLISTTLPLLIWGTIFGSQPHKEERFLYPIYPLITLSGSIFIASAYQILRSIKIPKLIIRLSQIALVIIIGLISILRSINLVENYSAPLQVYQSFPPNANNSQIVNVCTGREWYHYPNSFFLPNNYRLRFVKSGFDGLLPGDFLEGSILEGTSRIPLNMNNKNHFENDKVIDFDQCDYYIDNNLPTDTEAGEQTIIDNKNTISKGWEVVKCNKMIRVDGSSSGICKVLYIPEFLRTKVSCKVEYMDFCLMRRVDL